MTERQRMTHLMLQRLWTKAVGTEDYDKEQWKALDWLLFHPNHNVTKAPLGVRRALDGLQTPLVILNTKPVRRWAIHTWGAGPVRVPRLVLQGLALDAEREHS